MLNSILMATLAPLLIPDMVLAALATSGDSGDVNPFLHKPWNV
jgi:hypothetical protein